MMERMTPDLETFDAVVVGGGPAGATAAMDLARAGRHVLLLDRNGRIKPCGGAIPPRLIRDFQIPDEVIVARAKSAQMIAPSKARVDMPIDGGYVGMVDREYFDEFLRVRAEEAGAVRRNGTFVSLDRDDAGAAVIVYRPEGAGRGDADGLKRVRARAVVGADGANSQVGRQAIGEEAKAPFVFAYHEVIESPSGGASVDGKFEPSRCDVYYQGRLSPDFYAWVFPHGDRTSVGVGSAHKGFSLRAAVSALREEAGLAGVVTHRCEGAPIPLRPLKKWDNGRDVILAGDAAGCVAPASGEGIYYAMVGGRTAAEAVDELLETGDAKALARARKRYLSEHGKVFFILGIMQHFWYRNDKRRERFVSMCRDPDVQRLTWDAYMNKKLGKPEPMAHLKIFLKDMAHLFGMVAPNRQAPPSQP